MERQEIYEAVWGMMDDDFGCESCPFYEECHRRELWWGCAQYEEDMGEDL